MVLSLVVSWCLTVSGTVVMCSVSLYGGIYYMGYIRSGTWCHTTGGMLSGDYYMRGSYY